MIGSTGVVGTKDAAYVEYGANVFETGDHDLARFHVSMYNKSARSIDLLLRQINEDITLKVYNAIRRNLLAIAKLVTTYKITFYDVDCELQSVPLECVLPVFTTQGQGQDKRVLCTTVFINDKDNTYQGIGCKEFFNYLHTFAHGGFPSKTYVLASNVLEETVKVFTGTFHMITMDVMMHSEMLMSVLGLKIPIPQQQQKPQITKMLFGSRVFYRPDQVKRVGPLSTREAYNVALFINDAGTSNDLHAYSGSTQYCGKYFPSFNFLMPYIRIESDIVAPSIVDSDTRQILRIIHLENLYGDSAANSESDEYIVREYQKPMYMQFSVARFQTVTVTLKSYDDKIINFSSGKTEICLAIRPRR